MSGILLNKIKNNIKQDEINNVKKSKKQFTALKDASHVQSHADRTGRNQDFKRRMR